METTPAASGQVTDFVSPHFDTALEHLSFTQEMVLTVMFGVILFHLRMVIMICLVWQLVVISLSPFHQKYLCLLGGDNIREGSSFYLLSCNMIMWFGEDLIFAG